MSDYSYLVSNPEDGSAKLLHANKLRAYIPRVNITGMIETNDDDFGAVKNFPSISKITHEDKFESELSKVDVSNLCDLDAAKMVALLRDIF